jgi:hypothetical protein
MIKFLLTCLLTIVHRGLIVFADSARSTYIIGASPIWGVDRLFAEFNFTFERYLTEEVGRRFDPPISFKMVAVDTDQWHTGAEMIRQDKLDFIYTGAAMMSCHQTVYQVEKS